MEQNSSSQADISSTTQEIPLIFFWGGDPKVYFRVQQIPPPVSVQRQINPVHALQISFFMSGFNILLPSTPMSSLYDLLPSSIHCTFPHHIIQDTNSYYKETQSARLHPDTYLRLRYIRDLYSILTLPVLRRNIFWISEWMGALT
jgi:hypothetical protein